MKTINLNTYEGVEVMLFPDGQPHVKITTPIYQQDTVTVVASLTNTNRIIQLLQIVEVLNRKGCTKYLLKIPYLMGARYDRVMGEEDSFDLRVIANIINSMGFKWVDLYDPHSDVAPALINGSNVVSNWRLVYQYDQPEAVLIIPDAGAAKKAEKYFGWNSKILDSVQCIKHRDISTGKIQLKVLEPEKCTDRNCVIIDDICDGGATFLAIADQIKPLHLTLIVTHGIFSKGFKQLEGKFNKIISSTSYSEDLSSHIITRYDLSNDII